MEGMQLGAWLDELVEVDLPDAGEADTLGDVLRYLNLNVVATTVTS
jgi:hypothetical protein